MLESLSAQARMQRHTTPLPLRSADTPRLTLDINLERIPLVLSEPQYQGMLSLLRECDRYDRRRKYRKWRPQCAVKGK